MYNKDQLEKLFKKLYPRLQKIAYKYVKDEEVSKDIVSQAFDKLLRSHIDLKVSHARILLENFVRTAAINYASKNPSKILLKKTKGSKKKNKNDLTLYFDLNDFSKKEILDTLSLLSAIYQSIGGDGLEIKKMNTLEFESALIPA